MLTSFLCQLDQPGICFCLPSMSIERIQYIYISSKAPVPIPNTLVSVRCVGYRRVFVGVTNYMWDTLGLFIE